MQFFGTKEFPERAGDVELFYKRGQSGYPYLAGSGRIAIPDADSAELYSLRGGEKFLWHKDDASGGSSIFSEKMRELLSPNFICRR